MKTACFEPDSVRRGCSASSLLPIYIALASLACIQRSAGSTAAGAAGAAEASSVEAAASREASTPASDSPLPPGVSVLAEEGALAFALSGATDKAELRQIDVSGQPFARAIETEVKEAGASEWEMQLTAPTRVAVAKGDALLASFFARVEKEQEAGGGETAFVFELARDPYTKSVSYAVPLTSEWRQVHVRFLAVESLAAGDAQMIFRLGYSPETLQLGGLSVTSFGGDVPLSKLPTTEGQDRRLAQRKPAIAPLLDPVDAGELSITVRPGQALRRISPYVYGLNSQHLGDTGATVRRNGGNRGSVYNWEQNFSNAGEDYHHQSDRWPCTVMALETCNEPAGQFLGFLEQNRAGHAETVVTVPMLDYASADDRGPVKAEDAPPSARFVRAWPRKGEPFVDEPDLKDGVVYQDEFVHYLVQRAGPAKKGGVKFYSLDNEPALWRTTHPRVHPEPATYEEVVVRSEATASGIKAVDPGAFVLGGVMFGWGEYQSLSSAPDHEKHDATHGNYLEFFLSAMKGLEKKHGKRLVDALDVHWYPEARGSQRITLEDASRETIDARLQAPRSLWDPQYRERSWITQQTGKPIRLIPWLKEAVDRRYPGTELAMTEYNFGATLHVSGGLAQVDVLGVLGREGVYLANYWGKGAGVDKLPPYIASAFRLYRNYDGKGGRFGDTAVEASVADDAAASVFAARSDAGAVTVIVINKHQQNRYQARIHLTPGAAFSKARTFVLDARGPELKAGPELPIADGVLRHALAPLSATLFELR